MSTCDSLHAVLQGTATTEAAEFYNVYNLNVMEVPSRLPNQRIDHPARMFADRDAKMISLYMTVMEAQAQDRPVLIGTSSVSDSEQIEQVLSGEHVFQPEGRCHHGVFRPFWWGCNLHGDKISGRFFEDDIK